MNNALRSYCFSLLYILTLILTLSILTIGCGGGGGGGNSGDNGDVTPEAEAKIGPEGGTIEVTKTDSPIFGTKIIVPAETLNEDVDISIEIPTSPEKIPTGYNLAGEIIDFGPNGTVFNSAVTIFLPYKDVDNDGFIDGTQLSESNACVMYYDQDTQEWIRVSVKNRDSINNIVEIEIDHFTDFAVFVEIPCNASCDTISIPKFSNYSWTKVDGKEIGKSISRCSRSNENNNKVTLTFAPECLEGALIRSDRDDFRFGTYEAIIDFPDATGVVVAFFLYKQWACSGGRICKDEIDFEMFGGNQMQIGTYASYGCPNDDPDDYDPDCDSDNRQKASYSIDYGNTNSYKIIRKADRVEFYWGTDGNYNQANSWVAMNAVPQGQVHVLFEIWSPKDDDEEEFPAGDLEENLIEMIVNSFTFTPAETEVCDDGKDNDLDGDTDCDDTDCNGDWACDTLSVGSSINYPPFESVDDSGDYIGFDIDLINLISGKLGVEAVISDIAWDILFDSVRSGDVDVIIAGISITEARQEIMLFSNPYVNYGGDNFGIASAIGNDALMTAINDALDELESDGSMDALKTKWLP